MGQKCVPEVLVSLALLETMACLAEMGEMVSKVTLDFQVLTVWITTVLARGQGPVFMRAIPYRALDDGTSLESLGCSMCLQCSDGETSDSLTG